MFLSRLHLNGDTYISQISKFGVKDFLKIPVLFLDVLCLGVRFLHGNNMFISPINNLSPLPFMQ